MATKRALCPNCKNIVDADNIPPFFHVNPDAKVCYCPHCLRELTPEVAIRSYDDYLNERVESANKLLLNQGNAIKAYQEFADIIDFDNTSAGARLGRICSLLFASKVRTSYINDAEAMLNNEADKYFRKSNESVNYVKSLRRMNNIVDVYHEQLLKKLTLKTYFFDVDCLKLYLVHLNSILKFKNSLLDETKYVAKRYKDEKAEALTNLLEIKIDEQSRLLRESEFVTADGKVYTFDRIKRNGNAEVKLVEDKHVDTKLSRYRLSSLDSNNKKCRYIKDNIFKDYTAIITMKRRSLLYVGILLASAIGAAVAAIFMYKLYLVAFIALIIAAGLFFVGAVVFFVFHAIWSNELKRKDKNQID